MSEMFNNIKMLKLFSWESLFKERIRKHKEELDVLNDNQRKQDMYNMWVNRLIDKLTPTIIYSSYIYMGNSINLGMIIITRDYFHRLKRIYNYFPEIYGQYTEMSEKMGNVQDFLNKHDVQDNIRSQLSSNSEYGLKISGNFSWGLV